MDALPKPNWTPISSQVRSVWNTVFFSFSFHRSSSVGVLSGDKLLIYREHPFLLIHTLTSTTTISTYFPGLSLFFSPCFPLSIHPSFLFSVVLRLLNFFFSCLGIPANISDLEVQQSTGELMVFKESNYYLFDLESSRVLPGYESGFVCFLVLFLSWPVSFDRYLSLDWFSQAYLSKAPKSLVSLEFLSMWAQSLVTSETKILLTGRHRICPI
jgi:hypothetical protein